MKESVPDVGPRELTRARGGEPMGWRPEGPAPEAGPGLPWAPQPSSAAQAGRPAAGTRYPPASLVMRRAQVRLERAGDLPAGEGGGRMPLHP